MNVLTLNECDLVAGGLRPSKSGLGGKASPDVLPPGGYGYGGYGGIDWGNISVNPGWWSGTPVGGYSGSSFNFFAPVSSGPSVEFFVQESNGFANVQASTPSFENNTPVPIGENLPETPHTNGFNVGLKGTFHLGSVEIDPSIGFHVVPSANGTSITPGASVTVKW